MPYAELAEFVVRMLGVDGPYTRVLDRTNWKVGVVDVDILMLSIVYRGCINTRSSATGAGRKCRPGSCFVAHINSHVVITEVCRM